MFEAVLLAVNGKQAQRRSIPHVLRDLAELEIRPLCLTEFAYEWCSVIYGNRENLEDWEGLFLMCLEVGFRHLDPWQVVSVITLTHTEHHRALVDVVFESQKSEAIADLLHAWTLEYDFSGPGDTLVAIYTWLLIGLRELVPFSPRLRRFVVRFVEIAEYKEFKGAGVGKFIELLDHLRVTVKDTEVKVRWMSLLFDVIRSSEGAQHLSYWYWELLVELAISEPRWLISRFYHPTTTKSLIEAQEWGKLECWIGIVWMSSSGAEDRAEEDLENLMALLFRQRPDAVQKLEEWIERWSQKYKTDIPELFERTCKRAHEEAQRQVAL